MRVEHFVTIFDSGFLPQGIALHSSLATQCEPFVLWVICIDELAEIALAKLALPHLRTISLKEVEIDHPELLTIKSSRNRAEYCWTLTPFSHDAVFRREPTVQRVTYVDADIFFFGPASNLLKQMDQDGVETILTDHAYSPKYLKYQEAGRFCVQFLPFRNSDKSLEIINWWQKRCIEWCYARLEDGKFGDQKYLETWPSLWSDRIAILKDVRLTLAPWNTDLWPSDMAPSGIFHFHGFRIFSKSRIRWFHGYFIRKKNLQNIYPRYHTEITNSLTKLENNESLPSFPDAPSDISSNIKRWINRIRGMEFWP